MEPPLNARFATPAMQLLAQELKEFPRWWPVLTDWLPRFDGFLAELECDPERAIDDSPALQIVKALQDKNAPRPQNDLEMACLIAHCPFNGWRARFEQTPYRWNPLYQSFNEFRTTLDRVCICYQVTPDMPSITSGWLLGMLYLQNR